MRIKLQHRLEKNLLLFLPLIFAAVPGVCLSQSLLRPGDLAITGIYPGNPGRFDFVPLVDLEEGTVIRFTDNAYRSSGRSSLDTTESTIVYTASAAIPAGTVISYTGAGENGFEGTEFETDDSGDNIIVYQVTGSGTTYIYGAGWGDSPSVWTYNGNAEAADAHSDIPPGLNETAHTIIRLGPGQNYRYDSVKGLKGTSGTLIQQISNEKNWNSAPEPELFPEPEIRFTVLDPPASGFSSDSVKAPGSENRVIFNAMPDIEIHEINADPGGDADGNGVISRSGDEFIEFVNNGPAEVDLSGWTFSDDGSAIRHIFPDGTVLLPSAALVLFASEGGKPTGNLGGAVVQSSNVSPTLGLDDRGDTPTLKDAAGRIVAQYTYGPEAGDGQSITRVPDSGGQFVKHSLAAGSGGIRSSPGTRTNGALFRPEQAIYIRGSEGWRMIAPPAQNTSFSDLFGTFRMQGIAGSEAPAEDATIYYWNESAGTLAEPPGMTEELIAGRGYLVYFFEDDEQNTPGSQGGFPKKIASGHEQNSNAVPIVVSATDMNGNGRIDQNEGYNLLGNPFGINISVTAVLDALEDADESVNRNVLIWNPAAGGGNGAYVVLTDGDYIAPFQGFFVRYMEETDGTVIFNKNDLRPEGPNEVYTGERRFGFNLTLSDETYFDTYRIVFHEDGVVGRDKLDAYKLFSLNPGSVNLYSREGGDRLLKNVLPYPLNTVLEIPLVLKASDESRSFEFSWEGLDRLPEGWDIVLKDNVLGREIDLSADPAYRFTRIPEAAQQKVQIEESLINGIRTEETETEAPRFVLSVIPPADLTGAADDLSGSVKLKPNYPNPFNSITFIPFELPREAHIRLSIWNIVGQKVATLIDEIRPKGPDQEPWNAADMPSGIYIAQLEVEGKVYIRKMTLIK